MVAQARQRDVRWTFVMMYSPAWRTGSGLPQDPRNSAEIANLSLNGILVKHGPVEGDPTVEFGMYSPPASE